jgi:transcription initiation factor IIE alpha subunit
MKWLGKQNVVDRQTYVAPFSVHWVHTVCYNVTWQASYSKCLRNILMLHSFSVLNLKNQDGENYLCVILFIRVLLSDAVNYKDLCGICDE